MNEFMRPDRNVSAAPGKTAYAEPEKTGNIRIVVDNTPHYEAELVEGSPKIDLTKHYDEAVRTENGTAANMEELANDLVRELGVKASDVINGVTQAAEDYGNRLSDVFNPAGGGFNTNLKNRTVSLALCAVLGIFGAHRFYEGKTATGILWACTVGCFGIGWLIDLIILINKPKYYEP